MTNKNLVKNVFIVIGCFFIIIIMLFISKFIIKSNEIFNFIKDIMPIIIAIFAAYLAFCFQRRQSFLTSLRDLWSSFIDARCELLDYTDNPSPTRDDYNKAYRALSRAIDVVRGVYRNVGETEDDIGFYPFEPLHDMRKTLRALGWCEVTPEKRRAARSQIDVSWNALRWAFLKEFSIPEPSHPIIENGAVDPRRNTRRQPWSES